MTSPELTGPADPAVSAHCCFHCGAPNPAASSWRLILDGAERSFCCAGCLGVAQTIHAAGLDGYYARRAAPAVRPAAAEDEWTRYDVTAEASGAVIRRADGLREAPLLLEGIHCAACVWLIETYLQRLAGVVEVRINFVTRRAGVRWNPRQAKLSDVLRAVAAIGYRAYPYDPARRETLARSEARSLLTRTAIALLAMMQVMMFAVPAYVTADGITSEQQALLDWASLALTLPVVLYCAGPLFKGALRDLRLRRLSMDVPIALGVGGAFVASVWATVTGGGEVYYDSVTMFVALLLAVRYVELRARQRAGEAIETIARERPTTAEWLPRYPDSATAKTVPAAKLAAGDVVRVPAGASFPADGEVIEGRSSVEEAVLTGESRPRSKEPGASVLAGSINRESPLILRVTAAGEATRLAAVTRLVERAASERPRAARNADRIAAWFVAALLVIAAATALAWLQLDPSRVLTATFAVLVVSCPCALSLATPAALAAAAGALARRQILAVRSDALETLSRVTHVVFDKTGTLTAGKVTLARVLPLGALTETECLALAATLERGNEHPVARALLNAGSPSAIAARDVVANPGCGVEGVIAGARYRLGRPDWAGALHGLPLPPQEREIAPATTLVALASAGGWIALFALGDALKPDAPALIAQLKRLGIRVSLLSGDRDGAVRHVARAAGIADWRADAMPEAKRAYIEALQREGAVVAMVGDGVNDAPGLAQAHVSLTVGDAAALTQWTADIVVLSEDLDRIAEAIVEARRTFRVIRQNLAWALVYNVVAIPLAASGFLTPLVAALGMSASSLAVVTNALRLTRVRRVAARREAPQVARAPAPA